MKIVRGILQFQYTFRVFLITPITFFKRVLFGRDQYWRQYFWNKWAFFPKELINLARSRKTIWIDALGGGEVTQIATFVRLIKSQFSEYNLVLSTNNPHPFKFASKLKPINFVFDIPWDIPFVMRRALKKINPSILIVIDQVRFPIILREARKQGIKAVLISAALANEYYHSDYMKRAMSFEFYKYFDKLGLINEESKSNYFKIGAQPHKLTVTGDMKFDIDYFNESQDSRVSERLKSEFKLEDTDCVFVAGSVHLREDELLLKAYLKIKAIFPHLRWILVPRYLKDVGTMENTVKSLNINYVLRSRIGSIERLENRIILVDTFGELKVLFSLAWAMFVGNSIFPWDRFGLGQNIVEPLLYCRPVFFGKYMNKWRHITEPLREVYPGLEVETEEDIVRGFTFLMNNPDMVKKIEDISHHIIDLNRDAVKDNFELVCQLGKN